MSIWTRYRCTAFSLQGSTASQHNLLKSQTVSLNSEIGSSLSIGFGGLGSKLDAKTQSSQSQASQVIRKATVQSSFKELYDLERGNLSLTSSTARDQLTIERTSDIERNFEALAKDKWVVDIAKIRRGDLLEAKVELEADPIFRMTRWPERCPAGWRWSRRN